MNDMSHDPFTSSCVLSPAEQIIYQMIYEAAEDGLPCPINLDLEDAAGFNSASMGCKTMQRLQTKGLIKVIITGQRFRVVQVVANGKWTANPPGQKTFGKHIPRGARRSVATDRKPYKGAR